jgi:hypothetical protein
MKGRITEHQKLQKVESYRMSKEKHQKHRKLQNVEIKNVRKNRPHWTIHENHLFHILHGN